jgi:hypothetical protein
MSVPKKLQSALWSYDLKKLNLRSDKRVIIEQILNHGTWKQLQWLLQTYSEREIKQVVKDPSRGIWQEDAMNYWAKYFNLKKPDKKILFSLNVTNYAGISPKYS